MRIFVDAMCADFGGIRTYVEHLLGHWADEFPDDELHVAIATGATLDTAGHRRHELAVRHPATVGRPWAQSFAMRRLVHDLRPDVVLATAPTTTMRRVGAPLVVVVHDMRHELRPTQFSALRRLLRKVSYGRAYSLADAFVAVSQRTLDDLHELHPELTGKPGLVARHGSDHVHRWPSPTRGGPGVAYAHHTNKNPALVIDAMEVLARQGDDAPQLTIIGLSSEHRGALADMVAAKGLGDLVRLSPYLVDEEFTRMMCEATLVVFPSDFEGFGLPVVEAMALGKPVVIGPEKATLEVSAGHAEVMAGWSAQALAEAITRARAHTDQEIEAAREWAATFTWARTVRETRDALEVVAIP